MRQKRSWEEITGMLLFGAAAVMLFISVYLCFSSDIWYDELFTMGMAAGDLKDLISVTARDVHPPLYYLIVHFFLLFVPKQYEIQIMAAKLVSVLPFFLSLFYGWTKVRRRFGTLTAGLFSFLLLSMPQLGSYTVEIRMYGWALFFITAGMLHGYELLTGEEKREQVRSLIFLTVYLSAACYTHYFACAAAYLVYFYVLVSLLLKKRPVASLLGSAAVCTAAYLPWLLTVVTRQVGKVKENYWIEPVSLRTLGGCVKFIFKPSFSKEWVSVALAVLLFSIFAGLFLHLAVKLWKNDKERKAAGRELFALGCIGVLTGLVLFGIAASLILRPVFVYRYMLPALGLFWLAFAVMAVSFFRKKSLLILCLFLLAAVGLRNFRAFYGEEMWKRVQMAETKKALSLIGKEDILLFNFDQVQAVAGSYLPNESYLWYGQPEELIVEMFPQNHALVEGEFSDEAGMERIRELLSQTKELQPEQEKGPESRKIWYFGSGNAREEIMEKWKKQGIICEEKASVLLERYWFNLYQVTLEEIP